MAQNTCITREEYILDEARQELETATLTDDPDDLRNTIARLVGFVEELAEDVQPSIPGILGEQ